jgi:hypothetical protein
MSRPGYRVLYLRVPRWVTETLESKAQATGLSTNALASVLLQKVIVMALEEEQKQRERECTQTNEAIPSPMDEESIMSNGSSKSGLVIEASLSS